MRTEWKEVGTATAAGQRDRRHSADTPLIELAGVEKTYRTGIVDYPALRGVDLEIEAGEMVAVVGPSGSGKSTILNMITGIDRPTAGTVTSDGRRLDQMSEEELAVWRGANVGIIFQFFQLLPTLSALENAVLPLDFARRGSPASGTLVRLSAPPIAFVGHASDASRRGDRRGRRHRACRARARGLGLGPQPEAGVRDGAVGEGRAWRAYANRSRQAVRLLGPSRRRAPADALLPGRRRLLLLRDVRARLAVLR
jgi:ABC-type sugar transport system ATPase subunit